MEDQQISQDIVSHPENAVSLVVSEDEDDEFRSCCGEDGGEQREDSGSEQRTAKIYFKGISIDGFGDSFSGYSGIGVIIEGNNPVINCVVQKRLDFFVEDLVAEYLALIDGLSEILKKSDVTRVFGFTDSQIMFEQIMGQKSLDRPLMIAFKERVLELVGNLEVFSLKHVPSIEVERSLQLAQVAIGVVSLHGKSCSCLQHCSICCDDKPSSMMLTLHCTHKFCSHCLKTYTDGKLETSKVPVRCPQPRCNYLISISECKLFLPCVSYEGMKKAMAESTGLRSEKMYCPHQSCSSLIDPRKCLYSSDESIDSCVECPTCQKSICIKCEVPWHNSLSCGEYQNLPVEERDASDLSLQRLAEVRQWKRCQQCRRMIELTQGCYHMTCWCGHEFCYACGAEYRDGQQTCQCVFWDEGDCEESVRPATPEPEAHDQWQWNSFDSFPMILDAYSDQERSQLALIQTFLAGGFGLSDTNPSQSPPPCTDSYIDAMKDLNQLPWLERFVSVISDDYYDDYTN